MQLVSELIKRLSDVTLPKNLFFELGMDSYRIVGVTKLGVEYAYGREERYKSTFTPSDQSDLIIIGFKRGLRTVIPGNSPYTIQCKFI